MTMLRNIAEKRLSKMTIDEKTGDYLYGRGRTATANVARRFVNYYNGALLCKAFKGRFGRVKYVYVVVMTWLGKRDSLLVEVHHDCASAEYYYTYTKEWD